MRRGLFPFTFIVSVLAVSSTAAAQPQSDEIQRLLAAAGGSDPTAADTAIERLRQLPPARVAPAAVDALALLPDEATPTLIYGDKASRLVRVLNDAEKRMDKPRFAQMLVDAWPRAANRMTKFVLLLRYGTRSIEGGKPMALVTFRDPQSGSWLREHAAAALVRLAWPDHRDGILAVLDAEPESGMQLLAALMDPAARREPDPVVIALAAQRFRRWSADPAKAVIAGDLALWLGNYSREHHGIPPALRKFAAMPDMVGEERGAL